MNILFADTSYYIALVNPRDEHNESARRVTEDLTGMIVTTAWVHTEVANYLSLSENRQLFLDLLNDLQNDPNVTIIPPSPELFNKGVELFRRRMDKNWSLTDCISFVVMNEQGLQCALTGDQHFEQAGYKVLMD